MNWNKLILTLGVVLVILMVAINVGNFFDLSAGMYLGYVLWFLGLAILYIILPNQRETHFLKS